MQIEENGTIHIVKYVERIEKSYAEAMEILNSDELLRQHMNSVGYRELCKLKEELQSTREYLGKAIKSAEFFMGHADCRNDSWTCKCSFCRDTESSNNLREARQYFQDKQKDEVKNGQS